MNLIGAFILIVLISVVLCASRRWALLGMAAGVLYLTQAQRVDVAGFNLFAIRFLEMAGLIRVVARREFTFSQLNGIDKMVVWVYGFVTAVFLIRSSEGQANQVGMATDAFFSYFTFRGLLSNIEDFRWFLRAFVILLIPYVLLVVEESITGNNPFSLLGGVEGGKQWIRHGRPRCFGSFRQPDTLGMFAATFIPLFVGLACIRKEFPRGLLGICLCLTIVWTANSGGPAAAAAAGLACWALWCCRTQMRKVRWGVVAGIVLLALLMKAPVWYIFEKVSSITGGAGWHRSYLIEVSFRHLSQWWLAGMPFADTHGWFPYDLRNAPGADITNQFIAFGLRAGLGSVALFLLLLTRAFRNIGKALATARSRPNQPKEDEFLLWGLGVMLVVHIVDWFGITYFDQMYMVWFMQLAFISAITQQYLNTKEDTEVTIEPAIGPQMQVP